MWFYIARLSNASSSPFLRLQAEQEAKERRTKGEGKAKKFRILFVVAVFVCVTKYLLKQGG